MFLTHRGDLSWTALAALSPSELALVSNLGPIRIRRLIDELKTQVARLEPLLVRVDESASFERLGDTEQAVLRAPRGVLTGAVRIGRSGTLLEVLESAIQALSIDEPSAHVGFLARLDPSVLDEMPGTDGGYLSGMLTGRYPADFDDLARWALVLDEPSILPALDDFHGLRPS